MEELVLSFRDLIDRVDMRFVRYLHDEIDWNSRLIAILGTRGVGKTTLLLQHIKLTDAITSSLYVTADDLYFSRNTLAGLAQQFYQQGGSERGVCVVCQGLAFCHIWLIETILYTRRCADHYRVVRKPPCRLYHPRQAMTDL